MYDSVISALHDVSLNVPKGKIVALLGGNGAGKSTTLKAISTMLAAERGKVTKGSIIYDGTEVKNQSPYEMVALGMVQVLEGRRCFGHLTVEENIIAGAYSRKLSKSQIKDELEKIYGYFNRLRDRRKSQAGFTSGGEQQMLAIARALMTNPRLLILDEATEGLAPIIRQEIWSAIKTLRNDTGLAILIIDKSIKELRQICDRVVILEKGRTVWRGNIDQLSNEITQEFIGV